MELTGKIIAIFDTQQVTDNFKKREFVVEYAENPLYPQTILFQTIQDKTDLLNKYKIGDTVTVDFNLQGRKWESPEGQVRYFNSLDAWRVNYAQASPAQNSPEAVAAELSQDESDDLPF